MEELTIEAARDLIMQEAASDEAPIVETPAGASADVPAGQEEAVQPDEVRTYDENAVGLGVDIVEVDRMKRILERTPSFAERVFSPDECAYCNRMASPATHYALRFAAKEAIVKALGTGFSDGIGVRDIEVVRTKSGRPIAKLSGRAQQVAQEQGVRELSISLSYTHTDAVACAMAVTDASVRASEKRKDPMEELAKQFKEVRGMLDEL